MVTAERWALKFCVGLVVETGPRGLDIHTGNTLIDRPNMPFTGLLDEIFQEHPGETTQGILCKITELCL